MCIVLQIESENEQNYIHVCGLGHTLVENICA